MTGLAHEVRTLTREDHEAAETTPFVTALMSGRLGVAAYPRLASQHYFIYEALEGAGAAQADDPVAGPFVALDLHRLPSLKRDLAHLLGDGWRSRIAPLSSVERYAERL